jgi:signal peptidase II
MMGAFVTAIGLVVLVDQGTKLALRRFLKPRTASLGRLGHIRIVDANTWMERLGSGLTAPALVAVWFMAAFPLVLVTTSLPSTLPFVGLLLGGSLSQAIESLVRGGVTDYVCLRIWPAFNLADVAITLGALGVVAHGAAHVW